MTIAGGLPTRARIDDLARHGDAPAIVLDGDLISHRDLDELVDRVAARLGSTRRLVMLECSNELDPLVVYLAALRGGHPVLLMPSQDSEPARRHAARLAAAYRPDVVVRREDNAWGLEEIRPGTAHDLHPDLAVLLGTSGSTGTPKLVRLSAENLRSNAAAIADYLDLGPDSRAATTLPLQYCYGLSVLNSHLLAGGSVWLTGRSVSDPSFWPEFRAAGATSVAGVPHTFELLEATGADWTGTPGLRQITQAGGRMPAEQVRRIARAAASHGADLFVMYGQTEATARMAYLPPHLAADRPTCVGIPIEGGEFRIDDGELVFTGPNVMMGYAESPADLAQGAVLSELRTGDLAVQHDDGLYEIVGRRSRMAKLFGTRLDLDLAERMLAEAGSAARLVASETRLTAFVADGTTTDRVRQSLCAEHCLPPHAVVVRTIAPLPVTSAGKPDYAKLRRLAEEPAERPLPDVRAAYAGVFGTRIRPTDSFVSLGGDSLSYVESYVRLERLLGQVPADWPRRTVAELSALTPQPPSRRARLETPLLLRALAITLIVGNHVGVWALWGGAHILLAVFGFNLARFALARPTPAGRLRAVGSAVAEVMIPAGAWIAGVILVNESYGWQTPFALNSLLGPDGFTADWYFWFLESAAWSAIAVGLFLAVPVVSRAYARQPFAVAVGALAGAMVLRAVSDDHAASAMRIFALQPTVWLLVIGWVIAVAHHVRAKVLASVLICVCTYGFFLGDHRRDLIVIVGLLALTWLPAVTVPRALARPLATLASASLFIYVTHWQVFPRLDWAPPLFAWAACLAVGVALWEGYKVTRRRLATSYESVTGSASRP